MSEKPATQRFAEFINVNKKPQEPSLQLDIAFHSPSILRRIFIVLFILWSVCVGFFALPEFWYYVTAKSAGIGDVVRVLGNIGILLFGQAFFGGLALLMSHRRGIVVFYDRADS